VLDKGMSLIWGAAIDKSIGKLNNKVQLRDRDGAIASLVDYALKEAKILC